MRYFTAKEVLIATAFVVWTVALMVFLKSDKTVGDLAVNLLTDIAFAVFLALYIEHVNSKERLRANRARQRAVALAVQGFFQTYYRFLEALIGDAVLNAKDRLPG